LCASKRLAKTLAAQITLALETKNAQYKTERMGRKVLHVHALLDLSAA
jgi:hypothetical protein